MAPEIGHLDPEEELRKARKKAKEGLKRLEPKEPKPPQAAEEHWPGGPNIKTDYPDDFRLASSRRRSRRQRIARIRGTEVA